jgi:hypothetical protein
MNLVKEGGKLFGPRAERVTTDEMKKVFKEVYSLLSSFFISMKLTKSLASKETHGDIDFVVTTYPESNVKEILFNNIKIIDYSKNGYIYSILYHSKSINKNVHIDFICNSDKKISKTREQYFSLNDFSGIIGIISKKLNFKFGSEGFFKRFRDKKGNWHDIFISHNLVKDGLKILGYDSNGYKLIKNIDHFVYYISSSPLYDVKYVTSGEMNQSDRKSEKRPVINYVLNELRKQNKRALIHDEDYFFKKYYKKQFLRVEKLKNEINSNIYNKNTKYDGKWVIDTFNLKSGPLIGQILLLLNKKFGNNLNNIDEEEIIQYIKRNIKWN